MDIVAGALIALSSGVWTGAIVCQSAIVAPSVFAVLDEPEARPLLRRLFPRLFRLGIGCGVILFASCVLVAISSSWSVAGSALVAVSGLMLAMQAMALMMVPAINAARDAGESGASRFRTLHGGSVALTISILILGTGILAVSGAAGA